MSQNVNLEVFLHPYINLDFDASQREACRLYFEKTEKQKKKKADCPWKLKDVNLSDIQSEEEANRIYVVLEDSILFWRLSRFFLTVAIKYVFMQISPRSFQRAINNFTLLLQNHEFCTWNYSTGASPTLQHIKSRLCDGKNPSDALRLAASVPRCVVLRLAPCRNLPWLS